jgi:hypothetical protein
MQKIFSFETNIFGGLNANKLRMLISFTQSNFSKMTVSKYNNILLIAGLCYQICMKIPALQKINRKRLEFLSAQRDISV